MKKEEILKWLCKTCMNYGICRGTGCGPKIEIEKALELADRMEDDLK